MARGSRAAPPPAAAAAVAGLLAMVLTCVEPHTAPPAFAGHPPVPLSRASLLLSDPTGRSEAAPRVPCPAVRPSAVCMLKMAATGNGYTPGDKVVAKGQVGALTTYKSGWWTVELDGGGTVKSRAKDLAPATAGAVSAASPPAKSRATSPAPAKKKAASTAKRAGTGTTSRAAPAAKAAAKKGAGGGAPKKAVISPALQRVLDQPTGAAPAASASDSESVAYPKALANILDAIDSGSQPDAGGKSAAYPPGLSRVLDATGGATGDESAAVYPAALADMLDAAEATGGGPRARGAKAEAAPKKARGTATKSRGSATKSRGTGTKTRGSKGGVAYPPALQRYLDLSASTSAPSLPKKPARAVYPGVLANLLQLAASTPVSTRRGAKSTSKTGTVTRKTKTVTRGDTKPKGAKYPPVLARLLAAAQDPAKLQMLAEVQAEGAAVVPYPEALAAYLDLADLMGVPPTVAPPKRAA